MTTKPALQKTINRIVNNDVEEWHSQENARKNKPQ
jgi:hypothetical protein